MSYTVETIKYRGCKIKLEQDTNASNPREDDNVGEMWCTHRRYTLGDKQFSDGEEIRAKQAEVEKGGGIVLPLYLYDHSGITMSTSAFSCPWDSGQVGIIWATREKILYEWGGKGKRMTKKVREQAIKYLQGEVQQYDSFLRWDVVGFVALDPEGETIDSCWGFFPDDREEYSKRWDYPISEAKSAIDYWHTENDGARFADIEERGAA